MSIFEAIILGLVQGVTEFLPISSSGHLIVGARALGINTNTFNFDVLLHFGTLLALVAYFWRDLWQLALQARARQRLIRSIIISTLPAVAVGFLAQDFIEEHIRSIWYVVVNLTLIGLIMLVVDRWSGHRKLESMRDKDAWLIGLAQVLALLPGVSRSGSTILAARLRQFDYRAATRYSFLIAIPVTAGAALKILVSSSGTELLRDNPGIVMAGNLAAAISGFIAISFMLKMIQRIGLKSFGIYRLVLAALLSLLLVSGVL